jgi:hypothetical protein
MNGHRSATHSVSISNAGEASRLTDPESIIYELRTSKHITIITPIASKVLLAVTGSTSLKDHTSRTDEDDEDNEDNEEAPSTTTSTPASLPLSPDHSGPNGFLEAPKSELEELGSISERLASVLREEMGQMRWPEGA